MNLKFLMIAVLVAECFSAHSATVRLYFVDPLTNEKDTNAFYVTPIGTNVLSNGGVVGRGVTTRYVPASNGYKTNTLAVGHYSITNRSLGSGVVIRVPDSSSLYDYTNLLISGYNIFVTVTNGEGGGTSGALTNNETRAVTFESTLTIGGGSSQNPIAPSAGQLTFANSISADGAFIQGRTIIGTNFVGNGAGLTNLPDVATQSGLAAGSYAINGSLITNLQDQYTFTIPGAAFDNFSNTKEVLGATKTQNIDPGQWPFSEVRFPTAARMNGKLFVYFSSNDTNDFQRGGMFGFSGNDWEELGYIGQILTNSTSGWDSGHVYGGRSFTYLGTNWMTYMGGTQDNLSDPSDSVGLAYSTDGTNFTKYSGNPILTKGEAYEDTRIQHPTLFRSNNGKFFLFYTGWRSVVTNAICFATADVITGPWTKYSGNPVVSWITNGMTQSHAESPSILADKDGYHMWFDCFSSGTSDPRSTMETLAVAHSRDLTNWVISAERPDVFKPNGQTNNQNWIFGPQIVNDGGIRLLWEDNSSAFLSDAITKKNPQEAYTLLTRAVFIPTNSLSIIPEFPALAGQVLIFNSNGFPYILLSTNGGGGGALTWTRTNKIGW